MQPTSFKHHAEWLSHWSALHACLAATACLIALGLFAYTLVAPAKPNSSATEGSGSKTVERSAQSAFSNGTAVEPEQQAASAPTPAQPSTAPSPITVARVAPASANAPAQPAPTRNTKGFFELSCFRITTMDGTPLGSCRVWNQAGFTGTVTLTCVDHAPDLKCRFNTPALDLTGRIAAETQFTIDTPRASGDLDFVVKATSGSLTQTFGLFLTKGEPPKEAPAASLPNGEPDYSNEPHIKLACDRPTDAPIHLLPGESESIACTVSSHLGFSNRVTMDCPTSPGITCSPDQPAVTPPPDGSVTVLFTISIPAGFPPGTFDGAGVALMAFRNNVYTEPGRISYRLDTAIHP